MDQQPKEEAGSREEGSKIHFHSGRRLRLGNTNAASEVLDSLVHELMIWKQR